MTEPTSTYGTTFGTAQQPESIVITDIVILTRAEYRAMLDRIASLEDMIGDTCFEFIDSRRGTFLGRGRWIETGQDSDNAS